MSSSAGSWGDSMAAGYDENPLAKATSNCVLSLLRSLAWWRPGLAVLDFGCGTGTNAIELARRDDAQVVGVDVSRAMLDKLRAKLKDHGDLAARITLNQIKEDASDVNGDFDVVLSSFVLHHAKEEHIPTIVGHLCRTLRQDGRIAVFELVRSERTRATIAALKAKQRNPGDAGHSHGHSHHQSQEHSHGHHHGPGSEDFPVLTPESVADLVRGHGLEVEQSSQFDVSVQPGVGVDAFVVVARRPGPSDAFGIA
ncbi:Methyltransferase domain-containing protein [Plasmodiophora brassicae]|uniref:Methyltransferase domain-containing protein n=1 Tax=Plasmodiophora brassicae TaxID=37360 RepID=A0A0G4IKI0_PLABS|nr:hypothetical protein PBRA_004319 [Plasmodiophora brassicae]SPR00461.1 unnamed protein product [Plasmodiophora brassicae]